MPTDIDLYCLECGYNLRGLSGDPRRCPECGFENPMGDLELPAPLIRQQLREMETAPTICVGSGLVLVVLAILVVPYAPMVPRIWELVGPGLICAGLPLTLLALMWVSHAAAFRSSCNGKPGWVWLLWRFHCYGAMLVLAVGLPTLAGGLFLQSATWRQWKERAGPPGKAGDVVLLIAAVGWVYLLWFLIRWGYARAKQDIEPMQRQVALEIARDSLRKRLASQRRWGRIDDGAGHHA